MKVNRTRVDRLVAAMTRPDLMPLPQTSEERDAEIQRIRIEILKQVTPERRKAEGIKIIKDMLAMMYEIGYPGWEEDLLAMIQSR